MAYADEVTNSDPTTDAVPIVLVHGWGGSFATTWEQSGFTALIAVPLSLMLGMLSAAYPNSLLDRSISISSLRLRTPS